MIKFFEKWILPSSLGSWQETLMANQPLVASFRPFSLIGLVLLLHIVLWLVSYALPISLSAPLVSVYYSFLFLLVALMGVLFGTIIYFNRTLKQLVDYPLDFFDNGRLFIIGLCLSLVCFTLPFTCVGTLLKVHQKVYQEEKTGEDFAKFQVLVKKYPSYSLQGTEHRYVEAVGYYRDDVGVSYVAAFNRHSFESQYVTPVSERINAEYEALADEEAKVSYLNNLANDLLGKYRVDFSEKSFLQLKDRLSMAVIANLKPTYWSAEIIYGVLLLSCLFGSLVAYTNFRKFAIVAGITIVLLGLVMVLFQLLNLLLSTLGFSSITIASSFFLPGIIGLFVTLIIGCCLQIKWRCQLRFGNQMLIVSHLLLIILVFYFGNNRWVNLALFTGGGLLIASLAARLSNLPVQQLRWGIQHVFNRKLTVKNLAANNPLLWDVRLPLALFISGSLFILSLLFGLNDSSTPLEILNASSSITGENYMGIIFVGLIPFVFWVRRINHLRYSGGFSSRNYLRLSIAIASLGLLIFMSLTPYDLIREYKLTEHYTKEVIQQDLKDLITVDEFVDENYYYDRLSALGIPALRDTIYNDLSLFSYLGLDEFVPESQPDSNLAKQTFLRYGVFPPQPFEFSGKYNSPYQEARQSLESKLQVLLDIQYGVGGDKKFLFNVLCPLFLIVFLVLFQKSFSLQYWVGLYLLGLFFLSVLDTYNPSKGFWNPTNTLITVLVFSFFLIRIYYQLKHPQKGVNKWQYIGAWLLAYGLFVNYLEQLGIYGPKLWHFPVLVIASLLFFQIEYVVRKKIIYPPQGGV